MKHKHITGLSPCPMNQRMTTIPQRKQIKKCLKNYLEYGWINENDYKVLKKLNKSGLIESAGYEMRPFGFTGVKITFHELIIPAKT